MSMLSPYKLVMPFAFRGVGEPGPPAAVLRYKAGVNDPSAVFGNSWVTGARYTAQADGNLRYAAHRLVPSIISTWFITGGATHDGNRTITFPSAGARAEARSGTEMAAVPNGISVRIGARVRLVTSGVTSVNLYLEWFDGTDYIGQQPVPLVYNEWVEVKSDFKAVHNGTPRMVFQERFGAPSAPYSVEFEDIICQCMPNVNEAPTEASFDTDQIEYTPGVSYGAQLAVPGMLWQGIALSNQVNNTMVGAAVGVTGSGGEIPTGWALSNLPSGSVNIVSFDDDSIRLAINRTTNTSISIVLASPNPPAVAGEDVLLQTQWILHRQDGWFPGANLRIWSFQGGSGLDFRDYALSTVIDEVDNGFVHHLMPANTTNYYVAISLTTSGGTRTYDFECTLRMPQAVKGLVNGFAPFVRSGGELVTSPADVPVSVGNAAHTGPATLVCNAAMLEPATATDVAACWSDGTRNWEQNWTYDATQVNGGVRVSGAGINRGSYPWNPCEYYNLRNVWVTGTMTIYRDDANPLTGAPAQEIQGADVVTVGATGVSGNRPAVMYLHELVVQATEEHPA